MKIMMIMMIMMIITIMTMVIIVAPSNYQSTQIVRKAGTTKPLNWKNRLRAGAIEKLKSCTPWTNLDREPQLCQFFDSKSNSRTENPFESATSALKALPPPRQSFDVAQPKLNSGTLRDLALETARQAAPQVNELEKLD